MSAGQADSVKSNADASTLHVQPSDGRRMEVDRARLARVFGQTFPDLTSDEVDQREQAAITDEFLNENRPPHYDR